MVARTGGQWGVNTHFHPQPPRHGAYQGGPGGSGGFTHTSTPINHDMGRTKGGRAGRQCGINTHFYPNPPRHGACQGGQRGGQGRLTPTFTPDHPDSGRTNGGLEAVWDQHQVLPQSTPTWVVPRGAERKNRADRKENICTIRIKVRKEDVTPQNEVSSRHIHLTLFLAAGIQKQSQVSSAEHTLTLRGAVQKNLHVY